MSTSVAADIVLIIFRYTDIFILAFFIGSLFLSYRVYNYNSNEIIVYAGWYHHYIKVNGEKSDEHNTVFFYVPIILSCRLNDGTELEATISVMNRIALKINNRLYVGMK